MGYETEPRWPNGPRDLPTDAKAAPHGILAQTIYGYQQLWLYPSGAWLNGHTEIERFKIISWTRLVPEAEADLRARIAELEADVQNIAGGALVEEAEMSVRRIHAEVERDVARQALTSTDAMDRHWEEINAHRDLLVAERDDLRARISALADEWDQSAKTYGVDEPCIPCGPATLPVSYSRSLRALLDRPAADETNGETP